MSRPSCHPRFARHVTQLGGVVIEPGDIVMVAILVAYQQSDGAKSASALSNLAFGHGIHHCLGATLARAEARVCLQRLAGRYPGMRLAVDKSSLEWRPGVLMHGLAQLPVSLS